MLNYKIGLCNVWWGYDDVDTRAFTNSTEQENYFKNLIDGRWSTPVNFIMRNNINPTITYTDEHNQSIEQVLQYNYCVIQISPVSDNDSTNEAGQVAEIPIYRFFFINNITHTGGKTYSIDLELDDIQTNYFYNNVRDTLKNVYIQRSHVDRFNYVFKNNNDEYCTEINWKSGSPVAYPENISTPQLKIETSNKIPLMVDSTHRSDATTMTKLDKWLNDNILGWEYYYFATDYEPIHYELKSTYPTTTLGYKNELRGALCCYCYPVYKYNGTNKYTILAHTKQNDSTEYHDYEISYIGMEAFIKNNNLSAHLYARKFSIKPPFNVQEYTEYDETTGGIQDKTYKIDDTYLNLTITTTFEGYYNHYWDFKIFDYDGGYYGIIKVNVDSAQRLTSPTIKLNNFVYKISDIKDGYIIDPKLYSGQFSKYVLRREGDTFDYVPLKTGGTFQIEYNEALTPDITRYYARNVYNSESWYGTNSRDNLTGLVGALDQSLMVSSDKLADMLSNSRNYYMQNNANWGMQALQNVGQMLGGNIAGGISGLLGTGLDIWQEGMNRDNLQYAPNTIKNANGDMYFANQVYDDGIYLDTYTLNDSDKKSVLSKLKLYGYNLGIIDDVTNYDRVRNNYVYMEIYPDSITANISNLEKSRLKSRLKAVRFWYNDDVDYDVPNYETRFANL